MLAVPARRALDVLLFTMSSRLRTVVVDDHPVFRQGLRDVIAADPRSEVVAEAVDGVSGLDAVGRAKAEVVILDINLPGLNGLEVAQRLQASRSSVKVVILTMHKEEALFNKVMNLDVKGYLLKEDAAADIVNCLKTVAAGDYYLTASMSRALLRRRQRADALAASENGPGLESLTTGERRVLNRIGTNQTSKQIAREFGVSHRTIEAHRANICSKLDLHGSHRLLQFAIEHRSEL